MREEFNDWERTASYDKLVEDANECRLNMEWRKWIWVLSGDFPTAGSNAYVNDLPRRLSAQYD